MKLTPVNNQSTRSQVILLQSLYSCELNVHLLSTLRCNKDHVLAREGFVDCFISSAFDSFPEPVSGSLISLHLLLHVAIFYSIHILHLWQAELAERPCTAVWQTSCRVSVTSPLCPVMDKHKIVGRVQRGTRGQAHLLNQM